MKDAGLIDEVHLTSLEGLGSSYRMKGYFTMKGNAPEEGLQIEFSGVAFGGTYGGHNVNVELSDESSNLLKKALHLNDNEIDELLTEVQRRMLNNEMVVEFDKLKPEEPTNESGLP